MEKEGNEQTVCMLCEVSSDNRPLIKMIHENKDANVCVRCLPQLIHGSH